MRGVRLMVPVAALAIAVLVLLVAASPATILPGGGPLPDGDSPHADCYVYAELDGTLPADNAKFIRCTDGDPTCDTDGRCNDSCLFRARLCTGQPGNASCEFPPALDSIRVSGRCPLVAPESLTGSACGAFVDFEVPLRQGPRRVRPARVRCTTLGKAERGVRPRSDRDVFVFNCLPRTGECPYSSPSGAFLEPPIDLLD